MKIQDKVVVITGGASGLGQATVRYFSELGARLAIFDINEEAGNITVAELGEDRVLFCATDVTSEESVNAAVNAVLKKFLISTVSQPVPRFENQSVYVLVSFYEKRHYHGNESCSISTRPVTARIFAGLRYRGCLLCGTAQGSLA